MLASAITKLALSPVVTQRHKDIYAAVEAAAIAVRQCVVTPSTCPDTPAGPPASLGYFGGADVVRSELVSAIPAIEDKVKNAFRPSPTSPLLDIRCSPISVPPTAPPTAVECSAPRDADSSGNNITVRQPIYTLSGITGGSSLASCFSEWDTKIYLAPPTSENLSVYRPTQCAGIGTLYFTAVPPGPTWPAPRTPCKVEIIMSSPPTTTVTFGSGGSCP